MRTSVCIFLIEWFSLSLFVFTSTHLFFFVSIWSPRTLDLFLLFFVYSYCARSAVSSSACWLVARLCRLLMKEENICIKLCTHSSFDVRNCQTEGLSTHHRLIWSPKRISESKWWSIVHSFASNIQQNITHFDDRNAFIYMNQSIWLDQKCFQTDQSILSVAMRINRRIIDVVGFFFVWLTSRLSRLVTIGLSIVACYEKW